ncbi:MAG: 4-hydroxy-tetrahydrodipicolinate synthase [Clostridia bacterium]
MFSLVFIVYTALRGIYSVVWTDLAQGIICAVFGIASYIYGFKPVNWSMAELGARLQAIGRAELWSFEVSNPISLVTMFVTRCVGILAAQIYWQRCFAAKDSKTAKNGMLWSGIIAIIMVALTALLGMVILTLNQGLKPGDAMPWFMMNYVPPFITAMIFALILAAGMSSADSNLNSASVLIVNDLIKPFSPNYTEKQQVDYEMASQLAKKLVGEGTTAFVISGTTGEAPTLNAAEKENMFKLIKKSVDVPVIAGVGTNCTASTIENCQRALECGADGLLVVVPYYNKPDQESMYQHFKTTAESVRGDIIVYNVPGRTGCNMLPSTLARLAEIENIVAVKEASGNIQQLSEMVRVTPEEFKVYTGDDALTLPSLAVGGYGVISVASQVVGPMMKEMIDFYLAGNVVNAAKRHIELTDIFEKLFCTTNPIPVKAALNMMGSNVGGLRLPLVKANPSLQAEVQRSLRKLKLV